MLLTKSGLTASLALRNTEKEIIKESRKSINQYQRASQSFSMLVWSIIKIGRLLNFRFYCKRNMFSLMAKVKQFLN